MSTVDVLFTQQSKNVFTVTALHCNQRLRLIASEIVRMSDLRKTCKFRFLCTNLYTVAGSYVRHLQGLLFIEQGSGASLSDHGELASSSRNCSVKVDVVLRLTR